MLGGRLLYRGRFEMSAEMPDFRGKSRAAADRTKWLCHTNSQQSAEAFPESRRFVSLFHYA